jgi:hypothetical protein
MLALDFITALLLYSEPVMNKSLQTDGTYSCHISDVGSSWMNHFMEGKLRYVGELRPFQQLLFQQGYSQRRTPFSSDIPLRSVRPCCSMIR